MNLGVPELLVILAIVVLLFGARKLPELGRGLGEAIKGFKSGLKDDATKNSDGPGGSSGQAGT